MKLFISKLSIYLIFVCIVVVTPFYPPNNYLRFKDTDAYFPKEFDAAFRKKIYKPNLILGNSKVLASIKRDLLEQLSGKDFYQLGYSSSSLENTYYTLKAYLAQHQKVENIILEVSWFSFNDKRTNTKSSHLHDMFRFLDKKAQLEMLTTTYVRDYLEYYYSLLVNTKPIIYNENFSSRFNYKKTSEIAPRVRMDRFNKVFPGGIAGINKEYLEFYKRIIRLIDQNNINLILFTAPEIKEFVQLQMDRDRILKIYQETNQISRKAKYFNFAPEGKFFPRNVNLIFDDSHHLATPEKFTYHFYQTVKQSLE